MYSFYKKTIFLFCCLLAALSLQADPGFETRRTSFVHTALNNPNNDVITLQAYKGVPVDQTILTNTLNSIATNTTSDFDIVKLVRVLCLSHGEYDSLILPVLRPIPFWLTPDETLRVYWSENHMIMWMSSDWLLHERYGKVIDSNLDYRLRHFLRLKIQYGFYEFYSSVYSPYTLSGLLNLADFAQDAEIKSLATQAAQRLLKDILMLTNDKGVFFPCAGRNYYPKYETPYGQNHSAIIYLLTGFGQVPNNGTHASNFLASSTIHVDNVINSWTANLDTLYKIGHSLTQGFIINQNVARNDKVIFQWSAGGYFHPDVAQSTAQLVTDYNLWQHMEFSDFSAFAGFPPALAEGVANIASAISKSSVISGQDIVIYKNKSITLSSIQDFWKGKNGYQEFPLAANVGTTAVFTASGKPTSNWSNIGELHANTHLPYVQQKKNVALVMYRPEKSLALFGFKDEKINVSLFWQDAKYDEMRESGNWLLGRQGNSYVAVRRHCIKDINGVRACDNPDGQTWIIMVGNQDLHGSFDNFEAIVRAASYEEKWYFNLPTFQWVYYSKIVVDGKTLEYAWNGDLLSGPTQQPTALSNHRNTKELSVYPNPASQLINIDCSAFHNKEIQLSIYNLLGELIFEDNSLLNSSVKQINTQNWQNGNYIIMLKNDDEVYTQKLLIQK